MQISIQSMKVSIAETRPRTPGEIVLMSGGTDRICFYVQISDTSGAAFELDAASARVLIAALDQEAGSIERLAVQRTAEGR